MMTNIYMYIYVFSIIIMCTGVCENGVQYVMVQQMVQVEEMASLYMNMASWRFLAHLA